MPPISTPPTAWSAALCACTWPAISSRSISFANVNEQAPGLGGQAQILADATASMAPVAGKQEVNLTNLNANITARGLYMDAQKLGDLTATAQTAGTT